jgi:hypothetical protein
MYPWFFYENGHSNGLQGMNMYIKADKPVTDTGDVGVLRVYNTQKG